MFSTNGRSSRNKFWFIAVPCLFILIAIPFAVLFSLPVFLSIASSANGFLMYSVAGLASILFSVFIMGLYFTTLVKRFHDRNKRGLYEAMVTSKRIMSGNF